MSLRFLLDTNILSEPTRRHPHPTVITKLQEHEGEVATSATVWHELRFGCSRLADSQKRRFSERYLTQIIRLTIPILPYDAEAATWHGVERARLMEMGKTPSFPDSQIAAVARVNHLIWVTNNVSDYQDFFDLDVQNWFQ